MACSAIWILSAGNRVGADAANVPEKILIVGPAWIGDMVMAQSLFKLLRQANPSVIIDVVAPAWSQALLTRMNEVRGAVTMPLGHGQIGLARRFEIGRRLRPEGYDHAIVLPRSMKAALVPFFANIPIRTGFRGEMRFGLLNDVRKLDALVLNQTVKRLIALGLPPGANLPEPPQPKLEIDEQNRSELLSRFDIDGGRAMVALMPGAAYGPAKCWPIEYFAELAGHLVRAGVEVIVLGSEGEKSVGEEIRKRAGDSVRNLCGLTRLEDTVDILSVAPVTVSNDSGLMHVAAAAGTHVVAIYGSSSPDFTPPLTNQKTIYYLSLECSPCFSRDCPLSHLRCLRDIKPDHVLAGVSTVLEQQAA